jgi:hypothetical protein
MKKMVDNLNKNPELIAIFDFLKQFNASFWRILACLQR